MTDGGIYFALLEWGVWSAGRRRITERRDELAGDFRITQTVLERLVANRQSWFPRHIEAIDKAVASLKLEHDDRMLYFLLGEYFLNWKTIERIAQDENLSEHHVVNYLHRALRIVSQRLPICEARVRA